MHDSGRAADVDDDSGRIEIGPAELDIDHERRAVQPLRGSKHLALEAVRDHHVVAHCDAVHSVLPEYLKPQAASLNLQATCYAYRIRWQSVFPADAASFGMIWGSSSKSLSPLMTTSSSACTSSDSASCIRRRESHRERCDSAIRPTCDDFNVRRRE